MADEYVVDTGVFLRWYVDQVGFEHAREVQKDFLAGQVDLQTVDSIRIEFAHVLHVEGVRKKRVDVADYLTLIRLADLGIDVRSTDEDDLERAADLAVRYNLKLFDALVADRALQSGLPLLTSDKRLGNAIGHLLEVEILRGV